MKITKDMVVKSIKTFYQTCDKKRCRHAEAFVEANREITILTQETLAMATLELLEGGHNLNPMEVVSSYLISTGIHLGYRLKEVELETEKEVNELNKSL